MNKTRIHLVAAATVLTLVAGLLACSEEASILPTSSTPLTASDNGRLGMTLSPVGATAPPAPTPTPAPQPTPEPTPPQDGDPVTVRGGVFGVSGCPDDCVIDMKQYQVKVPASTRVVQNLGGLSYERTVDDLRAGLPLKVKGTYRSGSVKAKKIIIKEDIKFVGTVSHIDQDSLTLDISNRAGTAQVEFWIPYYAGIVFGSPQPGTRVLVLGKVRKDLTASFIATRIQPE